MKTLKPFQKKGVRFQTGRKHSLLADDMGLGKTVQSIVSMNKLHARKVLIICLQSAKYQWEQMLHEWGDLWLFNTQIINTRSDIVSPIANVIIVNYELIISDFIFDQIKKRKFAVGVVDEAHYLQTLTSQRSKRILGKNGILRNCVYKFLLTGTPMASRPINLFPMLYTLANDIIKPYNTYEKFAYRFCGAWEDSWGNLIVNGATHLDDLHDRLKKFMLRRTDVENLPDVTYDLIPLEPNNQIKLLTAAEFHLTDSSIKQYMDIKSLGEMASLRNDVAVAKLPECIQFIKDSLQVTDKLVVYYYHRSVGKILFRTFAKDYGVVSIHGGQTAKFKQEAVNNFINADKRPFKILLAQLQAAGEAIDGLQKVCNHAIFVETSWVPKDILQAVFRLRRMVFLGKPILVQFLAAVGTIEYKILNSMIRKRQIIKEVVG